MAQDSAGPETDSISKIDTTVPHSARVWNYWLGGKDNYPVDHQLGDAFRGVFPGVTDLARDSRAFLGRAVRFLAGEAGVRQFLDIGTGLPTAENVHQIAQTIAPASRVVYVDNDPVVLAHARALLISVPEGATDYIDADLKSPAQILEQAAKTLDFDQPIALCLVAILHFVEDDEAYPVVRELVDALPSGSRLVLSHLTEDLNPSNIRAVRRTYTEWGFTFVLRSKDEVARFFEQSDLVVDEPGVVPAHHWRFEGGALSREAIDPQRLAGLDDIEKVRYWDINDVTDADINVYVAMGRKA